jgi:pilus assembly protein CpaC
VLSGSVADSTAVMRAVDLATAFVRRPAVMNSAAQTEGTTGGMVSNNQMQPVGGVSGINGPQSRIVNLLIVSAAQQVILEVKIAEVSKTLLDKLGVGVNGIATSGPWSLNLASQFLTGTLAGNLQLANGNKSISIEAEKKDGMVKILAEPSVMAISGQEGSFLAGGKILIPVAQTSVTGGVQVTLEEKEFGVGLKFTPTVLAGGRINLRVAPEVSELSREGVSVTATGANSPAILPLITTRRASTTVQLVDGQSFAIGGLIKNNTTANIKAFPILGELPIIGALFRSTDFQQDRTELLKVSAAK